MSFMLADRRRGCAAYGRRWLCNPLGSRLNIEGLLPEVRPASRLASIAIDGQTPPADGPARSPPSRVSMKLAAAHQSAGDIARLQQLSVHRKWVANIASGR